MDSAGWLGVLAGFCAGFFQISHVYRSIGKRVTDRSPGSVVRHSLTGSLARLTALTLIFLVAGLSDRVQMKACVFAFVATHLAGLLALGVLLSKGSGNTDEQP